MIEPVVLGGEPRSTSAAAQWEMVVPKMVRPLGKPVMNRIAAISAPAAVSAPVHTPAETPAADAAPATFSPTFLLHTHDDKFLARFWPQITFGAIIFVALLVLIWGLSGPAPTARQSATESASTSGWSRVSISPPGRMLSVYEPSRHEADYRIEFGWVPDTKGVGWVFRTRDGSDYYATRLTLLQPGVNLVLAAEHFSVIGGMESAHSRKVIPLVNTAGRVRVRMDAIGPGFTLSLQDGPVEYWTDARLDSGAVGFYDERGQRPAVQSLRFTFIQKGAARTAVASLP